MPAFKNKEPNPYNFLLYSSVQKNDVDVREFSFAALFGLRFDILHIHWPEFYLNSHYFLKALIYSFGLLLGIVWSKAWGKKLVWTVHNLHPHKIQYPKLNFLFWKLFLPQVDGVISLSEANQKLLLQTYPQLATKQHAVAYHGLYTGYYPDTISREEAQTKLNVPKDKKVFLFLGLVKPYKNVEVLIEIFKQHDFSDSVLIIAGKAESTEYGQKINALIGQSSNIFFFQGFVDNNDLQTYFAAADFSVIPFAAIFNSGSALLSVSFNTPVILPYSDNFKEYSKLLNNMLVLYEENLKNSLLKINETSNLISGGKLEYIQDAAKWQHVSTEVVNLYIDVIMSSRKC